MCITKTQLSKRIKEGIEKCRFKLYKFLYNNLDYSNGIEII